MTGTGKATFFEKAGYGLGDMSSSMFWKIFSYYLPFFYSNVFGLSLAHAGTLLLITKLYDAVSDPVMGMIADRTETTRPTSRFVQDYNAIDFTSFSLSYDFNTELIRKIGMSMLRLQFQMTDVAHISNVKQERGLTYPYSRTFNLSVNVTF